jgi:hypothetical protein
VNGLAWHWHAAIFVALVVNLWFGGDLIEAWLGHGARSVAELTLIVAWLTLVIGMRVPLPWRRRPEEKESGRHPDA